MEYKNKITYFKEKKWIMALWFKRRYPLTQEEMFKQWKLWWKNDFEDISDSRFQNAYLFVKAKIKFPIEEIRKGRQAIADIRSVPRRLQTLAKEKGYYIKKSAISKHPLNVSGFAVFKNKRDKKAICGNKYEMTIKQVYEFLESK